MHEITLLKISAVDATVNYIKAQIEGGKLRARGSTSQRENLLSESGS